MTVNVDEMYTYEAIHFSLFSYTLFSLSAPEAMFVYPIYWDLI